MSDVFKVTKANVSRKAVNSKIRGLDVDTSRFIFGEIPTPSPDGSTVQFTLANAYVSGSLTVYRDQLALQPGIDFTETTPGSGIFTVTTAPDADEVIWCNYIKQ